MAPPLTLLGHRQLSVHAPVDPDRLAVDPVPGWAGEECDDRSDVRWRAEPLEWDGVGEPAEGVLVLSFQEHVRGSRSARDGVLNHYPAKKDFVAAWGERRRHELAVVLDDVPVESARDGLHRIMSALAEINVREERLTRQLREQRIVLQPVPEATLRILRAGRERGEIAGSVDPRVAAEIVAAVYFDTLSRWLIEEEPGFGLRQELNSRLDILLDGLAADGESTDSPGWRRA